MYKFDPKPETKGKCIIICDPRTSLPTCSKINIPKYIASNTWSFMSKNMSVIKIISVEEADRLELTKYVRQTLYNQRLKNKRKHYITESFDFLGCNNDNFTALKRTKSFRELNNSKNPPISYHQTLSNLLNESLF
jgi:hypothetical protein